MTNLATDIQGWVLVEAVPVGVQTKPRRLRHVGSLESSVKEAAVLHRIGGSCTVSATSWGTPWAAEAHTGGAYHCTSHLAVTRGQERETHHD